MTKLTYALVTPSYWRDLERCRFLVETAERFVAPHVRHYLIIAKRDVELFKPMLSERTHLIVVEDIIPGWLFRVPGIRHFWMSLRTRPVKNWILQQIVKLSVPAVVNEEVLLYADSDMFFVDEYDPVDFEKEGRVPLFVETGQRGLIDYNDRWQATASHLLGLQAESNCDTNYIGQLVCWRRSNALKMLDKVESVAGKEWQRCIAPLNKFSEYILYGIYANRVLGDQSGHWNDGLIRNLCYWRTEALDVDGLQSFRSGILPYHHSAMVSAKSNTRIEDIRKVFT